MLKSLSLLPLVLVGSIASAQTISVPVDPAAVSPQADLAAPGGEPTAGEPAVAAKAPAELDLSVSTQPASPATPTPQLETLNARESEQVQAAQQAVAEAKQSVAEVRAGKLISSGVTAGLALAFQTRFVEAKAEQWTTEAAVMPYVMFLPGYWGMSEAKRLYCASNWTAGDDDVATQAAMGSARRKAKRVVDAALHDLRQGASVETIRNKYWALGDHAKSAKLLNDAGQSANHRSHESLVEAVASNIWNPGDGANCGWSKVGIWVGKPLSYDATVGFEGQGKSKRSIEPVVAFGLGFNINAYVAFMVGLTVSSVSRDDESDDENLWSGTFAVGGNLDLVSALAN